MFLTEDVLFTIPRHRIARRTERQLQGDQERDRFQACRNQSGVVLGAVVLVAARSCELHSATRAARLYDLLCREFDE
jgi:hypothetical protein